MCGGFARNIRLDTRKLTIFMKNELFLINNYVNLKIVRSCCNLEYPNNMNTVREKFGKLHIFYYLVSRIL